MNITLYPATRKPDDYYFDGDSYWGRESKRLLAACRADPSNRQLRRDLDHAESEREAACSRAAARWEQKQARLARREWMSYCAPDDQVFDTMSGGVIVR